MRLSEDEISIYLHLVMEKQKYMEIGPDIVHIQKQFLGDYI